MCFGYEIKTGVVRILVIFQDRPVFSYIDGKLTPRPLLNDMDELRSILKNNQNTHYSHIFHDRLMFSHINGKLLPRPFE